MAVRIRFDSTGNVEDSVFILSTRNGTKLGNVPYYNLTFRGTLSSGCEMSFKVDKNDFALWDQLKDFKLIWARDYDIWFEIYVELDEGSETTKNIIAKSLGEAELSQILVYDLECNTEAETEKEGFAPTVFFDDQNKDNSLLNRLMRHAPHYRIEHVDFSIAEIKRVFSFDGVSLYDAFKQIEKEINCLFVINSGSDEYGNIDRYISVYDLESCCIDCGHREEFTGVCPECGSKNITTGYGEFTTIYVDSENLADNITFSTDTGAVKNCFRLEAGDDLMTETIAASNPNGSPYIWYISDDLKADMSGELVNRLEEYDSEYAYYYNDHVTDLSGETLTGYNDLISKYFPYNEALRTQDATITGFPDLVRTFYTAADFNNFITSVLIPEYEVKDVKFQAAKINYQSLSPVAVNNAKNLNIDMADNAALAMAKTLVDPGFTVEIAQSLLGEESYRVTYWVKSEDGADVAMTANISVKIVDDFETQVEQKVQKVIAGYRADIPDIMQLFKYELEEFCVELKDYSLDGLTIIADAAQSILDTLIEEGVSDKEAWANKDPDLYRNLYVPYYNKLASIKAETKVRKAEIATIDALQTQINKEVIRIQDILNFEKFMGEKLWLEFVAYRREDSYSNSGYTSDGLSYAELYDFALEFIEVAKKDIYKSANLQHSISATLKNLLAMEEFQPLVDYFAVGNWIQIRVDGILYRLRLLDYEINFDNLQNIAITFSDVKKISTGATDLESILNSAESMATSYPALLKQAGQNQKTNDQLDNWVSKGLALTNMKIVSSAENQNITWDNHGLLAREYLPITDSFDDKQLKLINKGLFMTNDNWLTSKAGIGNFTFFNPETREFEESYGVIADTLVGNLILGERVGVYNTEGSITLGKDGLTITTNGADENANQFAFTIQRKEYDEAGDAYTVPIMYVDASGELVLNGSIRINSSADTDIATLNDLADTSRFNDYINGAVHTESQIIYNEVDAKYNDLKSELNGNLDSYKAEIGQYLQYDENGLTLGATSSEFKTVIDNQRLAFKQADTVVAYMSNNQLYIPNAVIESTLVLGNFFFSPHADGGVSLTWQGN